MNSVPLVAEGIDTATFLVIVTGLGGTITAIAVAFYKHLLGQIAERDKRLEAYESVPELLERVERWMEASESLQSDSPPQSVQRSRRPRGKTVVDQ